MDLAQHYFGLQLKGRVFREDAAVAVQQLLHERQHPLNAEQHAREAAPDLRAADGRAMDPAEGYDFILHDVFTGAHIVCVMLVSRVRLPMLTLLQCLCVSTQLWVSHPSRHVGHNSIVACSTFLYHSMSCANDIKIGNCMTER